MRQMSFNEIVSPESDTKKTVQRIEPFLQVCTSPIPLSKGCYVRTKSGATYLIEGMEKSQNVTIGYEFRTSRDGQRYKKKITAQRERAYCYLYRNGKMSRHIIRQEDVVKQSPFLIDLIYKGDFVITKDYGMLYVEHKHVGKVMEYEEYRMDEETGRIYKIIKQKSQTYLLCDNAKKILYESDLIRLAVNPSFDYSNYLEKGMHIKCHYWGWVEVSEVMHEKALCTCKRTSQPFFVHFKDILDIEEE